MNSAQTPTQARTCRLNKFIANAGICSRRDADRLIFDGHIKVNDQIITNPGFKLAESDAVLYDDQPVLQRLQHEYIMLNKPIHVVTTLDDPQGRVIVTDFLPASLRKLRLFPVGRLDYFSEGLLLLTNDGELANRLMHPRYENYKIYEVKIRGKVRDSDLKSMRSGMTLSDGTRLLPVEVEKKYASPESACIKVRLKEGKNRQIRRMCEQLGLTVLSLKRIAEGVLELGSLPSGKWRRLSPEEIAGLKNS